MLRGDEAQLYRRYHAELRQPVRRAVHGPDACVEDACSFAWLQLLRLQPDRATVFGWLRTVAVHEALRLVQRECRNARLGSDPGSNDPAQDPECSAAAREALEALAALPARQRRYLALI